MSNLKKILVYSMIFYFEKDPHIFDKNLFVLAFDPKKNCGLVNWQIVAEPRPPSLDWPRFQDDVTHVAFRTHLLAIAYLILSTIWIITSLMLIGKQSYIDRKKIINEKFQRILFYLCIQAFDI